GWAIEVGGIVATAYTTNNSGCSASTGYGGAGGGSLSGSITGYTNNGTNIAVKWEGSYGPLAITQTVQVDTGDVYFIVFATFKNTSASTVNNIYYMRTVDPDNDVTLSGDYTTRNVLTYQNPDADNKAMVSTWGTHYPEAFLGLGTEDCRAVPFIINSGLIPNGKPSSYFNDNGPDQVKTDSLTQDVGVGLSFKIGNLGPGDSTSIAYTYCLSIDELDSAFAATRPKWILNSDSINRVNGDTAAVCRNSVSTLGIVNGYGYDWNWSAYPAGTPISPTTGPTVNVTIGTTPIFVTAIGTSPACFTDTIRMTITPDLTPPAPTSAVYTYCQYDSAKALRVTGSNITWYTSDTATTGSKIAPKPNTYVPGTYVWYVSQTVKGCEGDKAAITVIVHPGSVDSFGVDYHYGCSQDTIAFTNLSKGVIQNNIWKFGDGTTDTAINPTHIYPVQDTYRVVLTTLNNFACKYSYSQLIDTRHPLKASFKASADSICQGKSITFTNHSVGTNPSFAWYYGDGTPVDTTVSPVHQFNAAGTFNVVMIEKDFVPCYDTAKLTVLVDTMTSANFAVSDTSVCVGQPIYFAGQWSNTGNKTSLWDFGDGTVIHNEKTLQHAYDEAGSYNVHLTATYRICPDTSFVRNIAVNPYPHIDLGPDTSICPNSGDAIVLADLINMSNQAATWLWSDSETTASISVNHYGLYEATVTIHGCSSSDTVNVKNDCYVNVPNAFTPNNDGIDDYFFPRQLLSSGVTAFKMDIYDRWGVKIFETTNTEGRGWDGRFNGALQPTGVYIYIIDVILKNGEKHHYQGNVTLLR
ncbi:MAG TPA: PKD domain-containing protein, partial [Flavipsychrobacter sp.]|nr:PKD domain-containing protein [Flavipsychrobacter sp.]